MESLFLFLQFSSNANVDVHFHTFTVMGSRMLFEESSEFFPIFAVKLSGTTNIYFCVFKELKDIDLNYMNFILCLPCLSQGGVLCDFIVQKKTALI